MKAAVLGAGYMGSAVTFPLSENGVRVNLWGTWLDDSIIDECRTGKHPKLRKPLPETVQLFSAPQLKEAVAGADAVIIGVTSEGFLPVFRRYLDSVSESRTVCFILTKGFINLDGRICRISEAAERLFDKKFGRKKRMHRASIGGPVKAVELSNRIPTATVFGGNSTRLREFIKYFSTDYYRVFLTDDVTGVELSSALKNIYAITMGICDGMYRSSPSPSGICDNFKSFLFNQAVREMAQIVAAAGGRKDTVFDLAGVGDLYVTAASGRNGRLGEYIGKGMKPARAYGMMLEQGEIAEGYQTLKIGRTYVEQLGEKPDGDLPLFHTLHRIIFQERGCRDEMNRFVEFYGKGV